MRISSKQICKAATPALTALILSFAPGLVTPVLAQGAYYVCERDDGTRHITDSEQDAKKFKNCQKKQLENPTVIAAPAPRAPAAKAPSAGPASFPKVDSEAQRNMDSGRKQVLEDELRAEETKCGNIRKEYNNGEPERQGNEKNYAKYQERLAQLKDDMARCDANLVALRSELSRLRSM
jgi:hypothetical protein